MTSIAYAMGGAGGQGSPGGDFGFILMMTTIFLIFYFLLIRPQQKKAKEHQNYLANLKKGDKVITGKFAGQELKLDGEDYVICKLADILAIVD